MTIIIQDSDLIDASQFGLRLAYTHAALVKTGIHIGVRYTLCDLMIIGFNLTSRS